VEAVANWVWQGIVVAAAATVLMRVPRSLGATARYRLWWTAMAIVLALPFAPVVAAVLLPGPAALDVAHGAALSSQGLQVRIGAPPWAPFVLAAVWGLWTVTTTARVLSALAGLGRARRAAQPFPVERARRLRHWTTVSAGGRRAALVISADVRYAAVLGGRTPAIAISPAAAATLDDRDLDRIVVHEWAHVQRRDDCARLVQLIVRAVAGLHPGVWWLDRQIHIDRETACDDWAVNVTGSAKSYAASLTRLALIDSAVAEDLLQPAAITSSELTRRVLRLLDDRRTTSTRRWDAMSALVVPALAIAALAVAGVPLIAIDLDAEQAPRTTLASRVPSAEPMQPAARTGAVATRQPSSPPPTPQSRATRPERAEPIAAQPALPPVPAPAASPVRAGEDRRPVPPAPADIARSLEVLAPADLPGTVTAPGPAAETVARPAQSADDSAPKTPWGVAADAGVNVGRGSQKAAVATAGFFSKLGKSIARSF
jgi:bla regulator protein blaR1